MPLPPKYPTELVTIADHLRKRRLDLKLSQSKVAKILKVKEETITNWENGWRTPQISMIPRVIAFLGYNLYEVDTSTLGGKVKQYRYIRGLSLKKFAKLVHVDPSTVKSWEENEFIPASENYRRLMDCLKVLEYTL